MERRSPKGACVVILSSGKRLRSRKSRTLRVIVFTFCNPLPRH